MKCGQQSREAPIIEGSIFKERHGSDSPEIGCDAGDVLCLRIYAVQ